MANNKTILDKIIEQAIMQPSAASKIAKSIFDMKTAANKADYISKTLMRITSSSMYKEVATEFKKLSGGQGIAQYVTSNVPKEFANVGIFNSIIKHLNSIQANPQSIQIFDTYTKQLVAKPFTKTDGSLMSLPTDVESAISKAISDPETLHNVLTVASIAALFIPLIGPAVSAGISLGNAGLYAGEGKEYEAGLEATFALIPGLGKLAKMSGITQLGKEGMKKLAGKLIAIKAGQQVTLDATEKLALKTIATNKQVVETEIKKSLANRIATGTGKAAANIGADVLTAEAYDKIYLKVAGTSLDEWLTKWWDDWLMNPILESTNVYQEIANQISLNEQVDDLESALEKDNWKPRIVKKDDQGRPVPAQTGIGKQWAKENPIATGAMLAVGGIVSFFLIRSYGKKLGKKLGFFKNGKLTSNGANVVASKLDDYGLRILAKGLQETRDNIFKQVANGQLTRNAAIKFFSENGMLPKKYIGLGRERKKLETVLDNQITASKGNKLIQKTQTKKAASTKKSIKTPTTVSYSYTNK